MTRNIRRKSGMVAIIGRVLATAVLPFFLLFSVVCGAEMQKESEDDLALTAASTGAPIPVSAANEETEEAETNSLSATTTLEVAATAAADAQKASLLANDNTISVTLDNTDFNDNVQKSLETSATITTRVRTEPMFQVVVQGMRSDVRGGASVVGTRR